MDFDLEQEQKELQLKRIDENDEDSDVEQMLLSHNIIPLVTFRSVTQAPGHRPPIRNEQNTSLIGNGMDGKVFRATYNGKEVAVKVTDEANEIINWKKVAELSASAPPEVARHFPKIYELITDADHQFLVDNVEDNPDLNVFIVVMELLVPLNNHLKKIFFERESEDDGSTMDLEKDTNKTMVSDNSSSIINLMKDEDLLYKAYSQSFDAVSNEHNLANDDPELASYIKQNLFAKLLGFNPLAAGAKGVIDFPIFVTEQITATIRTLAANQKDILLPDDGSFEDTMKNVGKQLGNKMITYITDVMRGGNFPWHSSVPAIDPYRNIPETKSLLAALEYLREKGLTWFDVHSGNIMMRPSTQEPVLIDVAQYY